MRFSPAAGTQRVCSIASTATVAQGLARAGAAAKGRSIAMNHCGVLRKMTGFLERQECGYWCLRRPRATSAPASIERLDHRLVGVALLALVGDDAPALEAGRLFGKRAVFVDGVGDARVDAALGEQPAVGHPELEVLAAVARRGVDEAGAGVVGDMIAVEQRDDEAVAAGLLQRMSADHRAPSASAPTSPRNS